MACRCGILGGSDCNNNRLGHATGAKKGADSRSIDVMGMRGICPLFADLTGLILRQHRPLFRVCWSGFVPLLRFLLSSSALHGPHAMVPLRCTGTPPRSILHVRPYSARSTHAGGTRMDTLPVHPRLLQRLVKKLKCAILAEHTVLSSPASHLAFHLDVPHTHQKRAITSVLE
jgi:hypothetical protein